MPWYFTTLIILGVGLTGYKLGHWRSRRCERCGCKLRGVCLTSGCGGHRAKFV